MNTEDKKFEWTDELTKEFSKLLITEYFSISVDSAMEKFKSSKQPYKGVGFEIVMCMGGTGKLHKYDKNVCLGKDSTVIPCTIFSVLRIEDNTTWTIGDDTTDGKIYSFSLRDGDLFVGFQQPSQTFKDNIIYYQLSKIKKVKEPKEWDGYNMLSVNESNIKEPIQKPPLGLRPRYILDSDRLKEINEAIARYIEKDYPVPDGWMKERNSLIDSLHKRAD